MNGVFIFRRDYRLEDNTGLNTILKKCKQVLPIFVFNPNQIEPAKNKYFSNNCVQFLCESLLELDKSLRNIGSKLYIFYGELSKVLDEIDKTYNIDTIGINIDYTPYSKKRDNCLMNYCKKNGIELVESEDITLYPIDSIHNNSGTIYKVFTPFFNYASSIPYNKVEKLISTNNFVTSYKFNSEMPIKNIEQFYTENAKIAVRGGRTNALKILSNLKQFKNYSKDRDIPSIQTTRLSAYLKFGCISIREYITAIEKQLGRDNSLFKQGYWREFYYNIAYSFPEVFGHAFKEKYDSLDWENSEELFDKWYQGQTGCPLVDAGMRELNTTGYMHNRLRMVTAMFLTKDLLIDWRWGEHYFATQLVDYDPCQNNGGWQWSASTGTDSQPYFRIFNPYSMTERVDADAKYIKKWLPELKDVEPSDLYRWEDRYQNYKLNYPKPIVKHSVQRLKALEMFKKL